MTKVSVSLDDKPLLQSMLKEDPKKAKEIFSTFLSLLEISLEHGWDKLPQEMFHNDEVSFKDLIHGILFGALDLPSMSPKSYHILGAKVHPLAILGKNNHYPVGGEESLDWREWFMFPSDKEINRETISEVIRKLMQYGRWIDFKGFYEALAVNELAIWKDAEQPNTALLAIQPALRYQKEVKGELSVGDFLEDTGFFNCCSVTEGVTKCPACQREGLIKFNETIKVCEKCNSGYKIN